MNTPRVSVIIPVYNAEKYIKEAVDSVLGQTYRDLEIIIVDDGSTDDTGKILDSYDDARIRVVRQENQGVVRALNKAINTARGEYIVRMDADDISLPERVEKEVRFLDAHKNVGLVGSSFIRVDEDGGEAGPYKAGEEADGTGRNYPFCQGSVTFRKECAQKAGLYREGLESVEDYDLWLRISEISDVAVISEPLGKYRVHFNSASISDCFQQYRKSLLVKMLAEEKRKYGKDRLDSLEEKDINRILDNIFPRTKRNENGILSGKYLYLAEVLYCTGNYGRSRECLSSSLCMAPFTKRGWVLAFKLWICWILPVRFVNRAKGIKQKFNKMFS